MQTNTLQAGQMLQAPESMYCCIVLGNPAYGQVKGEQARGQLEGFTPLSMSC